MTTQPPQLNLSDGFTLRTYPKPHNSSIPRVPIKPTDSFTQRLSKVVFNPMDKPALHAPIAALVERLRKGSNGTNKLDVMLAPDISYNAGALLKNNMMVHLGLLKHAKSPEEVAFVLAHEMSHANHNDGRTKIVLTIGILIATISSMVFTSRALKKREKKKQKPMSIDLRRILALMVGLTSFFVLTRMHRKYQGTHETRCDREALHMLHNAGISVNGFKTFSKQPYDNIIQGMFFKRLKKSVRQRKWYGRIHPKPTDRAKLLEAYIEQHPELKNAKTTPALNAGQWRDIKRQSEQLFKIRKEELKKEALISFNLHY